MFKNGQAYVLSTVMLGDPRYARSTQVIETAISTTTGIATTLQLAGGVAGAGPIGSEIAAPLVRNTSFNSAMLVYGRSTSSFYPGVFAAQWDVDSNSIVYVSDLAEGTLTPTGFDASRWIDFMQAIAPLPNSQQIAAAGPVASTYQGDTDSEKLVLWEVFTP